MASINYPLCAPELQYFLAKIIRNKVNIVTVKYNGYVLLRQQCGVATLRIEQTNHLLEIHNDA